MNNDGSVVERILFNNRRVVLTIIAVVTVALALAATHVRLNASFEKAIPVHHPFIVNYLQHQDDLAGLGNAVEIAVQTTQGSIYSPAYLRTLRNISDRVFLMPGVDRTGMKSLWTPNVRWLAVTEDGFDGGPVIGQDYDGSPSSIARVKHNVERSGTIGRLVASDARSTIIYVPLLSTLPDGSPLDYGALARGLDQLRDQYQSKVTRIRIVGFAQVIGDLIAGLHVILMYFAVSVAIGCCLLFWYTGDARSTALVVACSLVAVVWQLGITSLLGFDLDPYSVLVPFLVFAIGLSHGAQKMNGIMQDVARGAERLMAARLTFRRLFVAGVTALVCDAVGFAVLYVIPIEAIRDLALIASIGVAVLVVTNLILLPILLSFVGVSERAAARSLSRIHSHERGESVMRVFVQFTDRRWAAAALTVAIVLAAGALVVARYLTVGDLDPGAPELRTDSRYNRDAAFMLRSYGAGSDLFAVMVSMPDGGCTNYDTLVKVDDLDWGLLRLNGVDSVESLVGANRNLLVLLSEGSPKWYELIDSSRMNNSLTQYSPRGMYDNSCNLLTIYVYLRDHRADTLSSVVDYVQAFAAANDTTDVKFLLAAGNAGIAAATNIVVGAANNEMLALVYAAVLVMSFLTFRSWRAVVCAILPLALTSVLAEALMVGLHIGVKVSTLPVVALGVGIGVDYSLYIMSVLLSRLRAGHSLSTAYAEALGFTGRVVLLTGITLSVGVATWAFSPIKFQADMGLLLAFMFLVNMLGALVLLPSLASFLLRPLDVAVIDPSSSERQSSTLVTESV